MKSCSKPAIKKLFILALHSEENMILDGDFFDSGSWCGAKVGCLAKQAVSRLEFASDEVFRGLAGLMWFVSEKSLDTYFSILEID